MGCCQSRIELEETISRCRGRRRYTKQMVKERQSMATAHLLYLKSLRSVGSALVHFSNLETTERHHLPPLTPSPPPSPQRTAPAAESMPAEIPSNGPALHPPPPPPPPSSGWDFWDPFFSSSRSGHFEWEDSSSAATMTTVSEAPPPLPPPPASAKLAVVSSTNKKSLQEIVNELDDYFLKAADAGERVSSFLEVPNCGFTCNQGLTGKFWPWGWNSKGNQDYLFQKLGEGPISKSENLFNGEFTSHRSTVEKLYAWEKKLFLEAKNAERLKDELDRKVSLLKKQEGRGADVMKVEKTRKEIERLESRITVSSQAIDATSLEIIRLRESELFPQLLEFLSRLKGMWRSMYECHQVQTHIVQQLEHLNEKGGAAAVATSEIRRQATLQLEVEVQRWHSSFCDLIESQRDYIHSLAGWLRLSLFGGGKGSHYLSSEIYSLLEEWQLALDRIPDKVASEGIKSFQGVVHGIVVQQDEESRQKKKMETAERASEKTAAAEKREKAAAMREKAAEEKRKWEKCVEITWAMTLNSLQTGFPSVFQAMTGFSGVCAQAFESIYGHQSPRELKMLLN